MAAALVAAADASPASEKMLQTHAVAALTRMVLDGAPILFAGDMGGNRRTPAEQLWAKATGLTAGEPDLRIYGPGGRVLVVELKAALGKLSGPQLTRHAAMARLGHDVRVLRATTGEEAAEQITSIVEAWLADLVL